jgi:hypothetical protein
LKSQRRAACFAGAFQVPESTGPQELLPFVSHPKAVRVVTVAPRGSFNHL